MSNKKQQYSIYIKENYYNKIKEEADKNNRSVNGELEFMIKKIYNINVDSSK